MITIRIEEGHRGPSILEMGTLLEQGGPIVVAWENTGPEIKLLGQYQDRDITLVVPDLITMERAASTVGGSYVISLELKTRASYSLIRKGGNWREFAQQVGPAVARAALFSLMAANLRAGHDIPAIRKVLVDSLFCNISPVDIDVLVAIRASGVKL